MLRSIIVMFTEAKDYRDTVISVESSEFLRSFVKLGNKEMMDYTFLCRAFTALSEETWRAINGALCGYAKKEEKITSEKLRLDTTAYESNIHYPTDSSLLWDSYRTLARLMREAADELKESGFVHRFHTKKVKKLALSISRNSDKKAKGAHRTIKGTYRKLIARVEWIVSVGKVAEHLLSLRRDSKAVAVGAAIKSYLPIVEKITGQAERRVIKGEQVPSSEKGYSLFEDHTELIKRGRRASRSSLGTRCCWLRRGRNSSFTMRRCPNRERIQESLRAHGEVFGCGPAVLAGDKGFYESREQIKALSEKVETVAICKKGRRTAEEDDRESTEEFKAGQRFRAGIEGTISALKRAYKLSRCLFKGFRRFASSVGCSVFCHNLVILAMT
ncbi:MAG: hypothetical protein K8I29_18445 [Alphaproteobacteria bacterium]|uniref:Transposase n=1 Tax=Candidatus Nitrobium versatile TaxID=2884831 RepID=A0A953M3F0_9BACT|nr:hypothetical protein [Candidatus Nitrobium versatile]